MNRTMTRKRAQAWHGGLRGHSGERDRFGAARGVRERAEETAGPEDLRLDPDQVEAVNHRGSALLVRAGPGSGKTRVLCHRAAAFVQRDGCPPGRILCITFTRRAAREMAERLERMLGRTPKWVATFHQLCVRILRQDGHRVGLPEWQIADTARGAAIVRKIVREGVPGLSDRWDPRKTVSRISFWKNAGATPRSFARLGNQAWRREFAGIWGKYEKQLREDHLVDFDDLLLKTAELLEGDEEARDHWRRTWDQVLVDECQDSNFPQYRITRMLGEDGTGANLTIVGDPDQSIYGWRGAQQGNIAKFIREFKPHIVRLGANYRSTPEIVLAATAVLGAGAPKEEHRHLRSERPVEGSRDKVRIWTHDDDRTEADWVFDTAREAEGAGKSLGILYRINALSRPFEERLIRGGIPYTISGGARFYDRAEVQDAVAYLRVLANPGDDTSLERILNTPARGIGNRAKEIIHSMGGGPGEGEADSGTAGLPDGEWIPDGEEDPAWMYGEEDPFAGEDAQYAGAAGSSEENETESEETAAAEAGAGNAEGTGAVQMSLLWNAAPEKPAEREGERGEDTGTPGGERPGKDPADFERREPGSLWAKLQRAADAGVLSGRARAGAADLLRLLESLRLEVIRGRDTPLALLEAVLERSGYRNALRHSKQEADQDRASNLDALQDTAGEYEARAGAARSLQGFLDEVALMTDAESGRKDAANVHLMTLHAAKGLEFPEVVITACEDGMYPLLRQDDDTPRDDACEEERRLFYVGMTRAGDRLNLSMAMRRARWGRIQYTEPSEYLTQIPESCVDRWTTSAELAAAEEEQPGAGADAAPMPAASTMTH